MCWVDTFPVALAATSSGALRGAPKIYGKEWLSPLSTPNKTVA
jgi:hypothetical protein